MRPTEFSPEHIAELEDQMDAALEKQDPAKMIELIDQGANPNQPRYSDKILPIFIASFRNPALIKDLIERGAKVVDQNGFEYMRQADRVTPLILVADRGHLDIVKLLVENGAKVNHESSRDETPLTSAVTKGHIDVAEYLLEKGANVNRFNPLKATLIPFFDDQPSLETRTKIAALLIFYGADASQFANEPVILAAQDFLQTTIKSVSVDTVNAINFGTHPRIGADSPVKILPKDVRELICGYIKTNVQTEAQAPSSQTGKAIIKKLTSNHHTQS